MKINDFITYITSLGISKEHLYMEEDESSQMVSFGEHTADGQILFVSIAFPKEEGMVEIYIRKRYEHELTYETLFKLNQLNIKYSGIVFFASPGALSIKFTMAQDCIVDDAFAKIVLMIPVAEKEFPNI